MDKQPPVWPIVVQCPEHGSFSIDPHLASALEYPDGTGCFTYPCNDCVLDYVCDADLGVMVKIKWAKVPTITMPVRQEFDLPALTEDDLISLGLELAGV